ncbi:MAG: NADH-quinone oxidoreductase subunit N [Bdellovibrionota bacterium]
MNDLHLFAIYPQITLGLGALLVLGEGLVFGKNRHGLFLITTLVAATFSLAFTILSWKTTANAFAGAVILDPTVSALLAIVSVCTLLGALCSPAYANRHGFEPANYYTLLLFSACGMAFLVSSNDLAMAFVSLETLSVCVYALTGYRTRQDASTEGAVKYFLLGAFATGFLLYGISFLYGATGSTNFSEIATRFAAGNMGPESKFAVIGVGLLLVGLSFKVGAVPFHMWVPDVYQGAPTPITAFMSVAVKASAFGFLVRLLPHTLMGLSDSWVPILSALALLTMIGGNLLALAQRNLKRLLAYSSVAHAGYLLLGVASASKLPDQADAAILYYLLVYSFMNVGAFAVLLTLNSPARERNNLSDLAGLSESHPLLAALLSLFMLALAGIPPTGGFTAKFYLFGAALRAGYTTLAVLGILSSVIGAFYYLRVVVALYMESPTRPVSNDPAASAMAPRGLALAFAVLLCAVLSVELGLQSLPGLGIFPSYLEGLTDFLVATR